MWLSVITLEFHTQTRIAYAMPTLNPPLLCPQCDGIDNTIRVWKLETLFKEPGNSGKEEDAVIDENGVDEDEEMEVVELGGTEGKETVMLTIG